MNITVKYGMGNELTTPKFTTGSTVRQVLADRSLQDILGFDPAQVDAVIDGQRVTNLDTVLGDDDTLSLETKTGQKGA